MRVFADPRVSTDKEFRANLERVRFYIESGHAANHYI